MESLFPEDLLSSGGKGYGGPWQILTSMGYLWEEALGELLPYLLGLFTSLPPLPSSCMTPLTTTLALHAPLHPHSGWDQAGFAHSLILWKMAVLRGWLS